MKSIILNILFLLLVCYASATAQVKIRIFADKTPESAVFSVKSGEYEVNTFSGNNWLVRTGNLVAITKFKGKLAVKVMNDDAVVCDSVLFSGRSGKDYFALRVNGQTPLRQNYDGDLRCLPDFGTLMFINTCEIESYIAGVVKSEGGSGKNQEYFKTQAVIARTYLFRYHEKHAADHYNLCDNTHCQAFNGITNDTLITRSTLETKDEVILGPDSLPIISAFHSNCGGETSPSEDVWLAPQPYLKKIKDPHCLASRNARWKKSIGLNVWITYLNKSGYNGSTADPTVLNFSQITRSTEYKTGSFSLPLRQIRNDFDLRSTFFSVAVTGDSVFFRGRGYGHGVGLCQEGAMSMAAKGFNYRQIINFYYTNVRISDFIHPFVRSSALAGRGVFQN